MEVLEPCSSVDAARKSLVFRRLAYDLVFGLGFVLLRIKVTFQLHFAAFSMYIFVEVIAHQRFLALKITKFQIFKKNDLL